MNDKNKAFFIIELGRLIKEDESSIMGESQEKIELSVHSLININSQMNRVKTRTEAYRVALSASLGSFLIGYELVCIGSLAPFYSGNSGLPTALSSFILSLLTAALPFAAIAGTDLLS